MSFKQLILLAVTKTFSRVALAGALRSGSIKPWFKRKSNDGFG